MKTVTLFYNKDERVGLEAPIYAFTIVELREAFSSLLNAARMRGWIEGVPPSTDPMAHFRVTIEEIN